MTIETPNLSNAPSSEQQFKPSECPETFPEAWFTWSKFFRVCLGNSEDAKTETAQYSFADSVVKRKSQCGRCEIYRDWLLEYSPIVRFMRENIRKVGGPDMNSQNIHCVWCDPLDPAQRRFGYFDPTRGVVLCQNFLLSRKDAEDTVTHEMVHAYDLMRFDYDNKNLKHVACTEIRAAMLSGECRWSREFWGRKQRAFVGHFQECIRRRTMLSMQNHPYCKDQNHAKKVIDDVWGSCFADTRPFDEVYR